MGADRGLDGGGTPSKQCDAMHEMNECCYFRNTKEYPIRIQHSFILKLFFTVSNVHANIGNV